MIGVIGKKTHANQVYYKVVWQGQDEPTWQKYADIPPGSRSLVNQYNRTNKYVHTGEYDDHVCNCRQTAGSPIPFTL